MNMTHIHEQIGKYPLFSDARPAIALSYRCPTFPDYCEVHGVTLFDTPGRQCLLCRKDALDLSRRDARRFGFATYSDYCDDGHGWARFHVSCGKCSECYTTAGTRRVPPPAVNTARAAARKAKASSYVDVCPVHGQTDFYVLTGKCLTCFSTTGAVRAGRPLVQSARAIARRDRQTTFVETCETHGAVAHSVRTGKCLTCYTVQGYPRGAAVRSARAAARAAGERVYMDDCATCGEAPHHVHSGKCAVCCTASGGRTLRALARTHGHAEYVSRCEIHGDAYHETATGRCLKCIA